VIAVFAAKDRPRFNPLIVHVRDLDEAARFAEVNKTAETLTEHFWPGGLTLVLPRRRDSTLSLLVSAGSDTVAIRAPAHPIARALIQRAGVAVAAPSANRAGRISPTTASACLEELDGRIPTILDGGPTPVGIESTIIGFERGTPVLLRVGAIPRQDLERVVGKLGQPTQPGISAPGMMTSHYAPRAHVRLNATELREGEVLLAFGPTPLSGSSDIRNLSTRGDLKEAAANLFSMLRELDSGNASTIAVMTIPNTGLGEAINDRLVRAAAPRSGG
jgi:L-threonylcarbamoyladenylate synthase